MDGWLQSRAGQSDPTKFAAEHKVIITVAHEWVVNTDSSAYCRQHVQYVAVEQNETVTRMLWLQHTVIIQTLLL